jgi:hypothetical protein
LLPLFAVLALLALPVLAQDLETLLSSARERVEARDLPGALEALRQAEKGEVPYYFDLHWKGAAEEILMFPLACYGTASGTACP